MHRERILFRILVVSFLLIIPLGIWAFPGVMGWVFEMVVILSPLWLPVALTAAFIPLWLLYARSQYVASIPYVLLEMKPGPDTPKTARAMELFFYSLYHRTEISRWTMILAGQVRLPWSFEVAAEGGVVRFFLRMPRVHREALESRLRAEYRDIDLDEVRDYARETGWNPFSMHLVAREFRLAKADPYPLSTYDTHEAAGADRFLELLEKLVTVGDGERLWLSFIVRPHQRERKSIWDEPMDDLHESAAREIEALVGSAGKMKDLPPARREVVEAIEEGLKKPSFDVGARAIYFADRKNWNDERAFGLDNLLDRFSHQDLNGFESHDPEKDIGWPLSDLFHAVPGLSGGHLLNLYRRRAFFAPPYVGKAFVLNTAELATVYHLPHTPKASALARASGKRLEPPENLPIAAVTA